MILFFLFFHPFSLGQETLSSTQDSVWPLFQTPVSSSKYSTKLQLCSDEGLTLETSGFESLYDGQFTLSRQLVNSIILLKFPPKQHYSFFRNVPSILQYASSFSLSSKCGQTRFFVFDTQYARHPRTELSLHLELYLERLLSILEISENVVPFVSIALEVC